MGLGFVNQLDPGILWHIPLAKLSTSQWISYRQTFIARKPFVVRQFKQLGLKVNCSSSLVSCYLHRVDEQYTFAPKIHH